MFLGVIVALAFALPRVETQPTVRGEWIEINTVYRWEHVQAGMGYKWECKESLRQIILWDRAKDCDCKMRPRVIAWHMYNPETMPIITDKGHCSVAVQGVIFKAKFWTETETYHDPERVNRRWFPQEQRQAIPW